MCGCHIFSAGKLSAPARMAERTIPMMKIIKAYGKRRNWRVRSKAKNAKRAHIRLSPQLGEVHPRGFNRVEPAEMTRDKPAPSCMPFTTGVGMTCVNHRSSPETLKMSTTPDTKKPADTVSSIEYDCAMAIAAIAFIGWTGNGIPNMTPVKTFQSPEKTSVVEREIDPLTASAIMSGKSVPKSPRDPEIS